jgi:hypothetical protein
MNGLNTRHASQTSQTHHRPRRPTLVSSDMGCVDAFAPVAALPVEVDVEVDVEMAASAAAAVARSAACTRISAASA